MSSLAISVTQLRSLASGMRDELAVMVQIEQQVLEQEKEWIELEIMGLGIEDLHDHGQEEVMHSWHATALLT